ncbi:MAG: murein L,D-transpeptidase catalytic domain family protein [Gammaproteobacteria bacterium]|jgi:hypothetical protein
MITRTVRKVITSLVTGLVLTTASIASQAIDFDWNSQGEVGNALKPSNCTLRPEVLQLAMRAYKTAVEEGIPNNTKILTIIDYSLPANQNRLWVLDLTHNKVLIQSIVAHGKGSGNLTPDRFSDKEGTLASSLGLFKTAHTYFGKHGLTLTIQGLEKGFNDKAEARHIVVHGAPYVNIELAKQGHVGRSWGCPAVDERIAKPLINTIKDGSLIFAYYPDHNWLDHSKFLHG